MAILHHHTSLSTSTSGIMELQSESGRSFQVKVIGILVTTQSHLPMSLVRVLKPHMARQSSDLHTQGLKSTTVIRAVSRDWDPAERCQLDTPQWLIQPFLLEAMKCTINKNQIFQPAPTQRIPGVPSCNRPLEPPTGETP